MPNILVIVPFPLDEEGVLKRQAQLDRKVVGSDYEFTYRPVKVSPGLFDSWHDKMIALMAIFEAAMHAEQEGFDAVCIDSVGDSGMEPLRSVLSIPVIGGAIVSYHTALTLAERFSIVTLWEGWAESYHRTAAAYGVAHRLASIRAIDSFPDVVNLLAGHESEIYPKLLDASRKCIDKDGAEIILLGSTTMHQAAEFLAKHLEVPVINPGILTYKYAELLVSLKLSHSRKAYPSPRYPKLEMIAAMVAAGAVSEQAVQYATAKSDE